MSRFLSGLAKLGIGVGALYVAYKVGESTGKNKDKEILDVANADLKMEIEFLEGLIKDYDTLPNKTQKDWDNKQMLEMKLDVLKRKL